MDNIAMNTNPTENCIGWWNNNGKWDKIVLKDNQPVMLKSTSGDGVMNCKLWRSSYERSGLTYEEQNGKLIEIEVNSLQELMDLTDKEGYPIKISPKDKDGFYWVEIDDYFED
jgi:hypothetical protein